MICVFFLPNAVAGVMDGRMFDNLTMIDAQSISIDMNLSLSLADRIALAVNPTSEVLDLETGQAMERETAEARLTQELERFFAGSPFVFAADGCTITEGSAAFVIDAENPTTNMIVWNFTALDPDRNEAVVTIDDETGLILKIIYRQWSDEVLTAESESGAGISYEDMNSAALQLIKLLTEYYGLTVRLGDFELGANLAYYRADIYSTGIAVAMYGVIRPTGFTVNERV